MKSLTINVLTAGLIALAGCANLSPAFTDADAVCHDEWYGYSRATCQPPAALYGVADTERDITNLKEQIQSLKEELDTVNQLIARLSDEL